MTFRIDCEKAQLVNAPNGQVYLVAFDGTTFGFRDESAKQLREKYSEQSSAHKWDFHIELNVQVAKPVAYPRLNQESQAK